MKRCSACKEDKPESSFYSDKRKKDGLKSQCKVCHTEGNLRTRDGEKKRKANSAYMAKTRVTQREKILDRERKAGARKRVVSPEKVEARNELNQAVRRGDIVKPLACEACAGGEKIDSPS